MGSKTQTEIKGGVEKVSTWSGALMHPLFLRLKVTVVPEVRQCFVLGALLEPQLGVLISDQDPLVHVILFIMIPMCIK